jgi:N-acetylgalactosamine-6-sulfatase
MTASFPQFLSAVVVLAAVTVPALAADPKKPNVVLIVADDLGYADLGCYGCRDIKTPHIDKLVKQGVRFTHFYSNGPECTPTRAALLTGRYQQRVGGLECAIGLGGVGRYDDAIRLAKAGELGLPADAGSLANLLKGSGYATALFGKWHLGYDDKFSPNRHGFDEALYALGGGMDYFRHTEGPPDNAPVLRLNGKPVQRPGYFTDLVADAAVGFVRAQRDKPFFLYVPFTAPHAPYQGPKDEKVEMPIWDQKKGPPEVYAAMVERVDEAVGRILAALDERKLAADTLVIFTGDNGGTQSARPTSLRGFKGSTFEGGIRVPCVARWPGVLPAGAESDLPALTFDLTASILRAAGAEPAKDRPLEGIDVLKVVADRGAAPKRALFWRGRRSEETWCAVRDGSLKYVVRRNKDRAEEYLFDLARDPGEKDDLLAKRADDATRLKNLLAAWERDVRPAR